MQNRKSFYSNGKLLLTGEYAVLDGALSLAVPTSRGQSLTVKNINKPQLRWTSCDEQGEAWFKRSFNLDLLEFERYDTENFTSSPGNGDKKVDSGARSSPPDSDNSGDSDAISRTLFKLLKEAKNLNPDFLGDAQGYEVITQLDFPRDWGLGSSSTLINNIAQWAEVDAYQLLWRAFAGSGYDIACAQHDRPILYRLEKDDRTTRDSGFTKGFRPVVEEIDFDPPFRDRLYFVHLNQKQNSREGIAKYRKQAIDNSFHRPTLLESISKITQKVVACQNLEEFEALTAEHEALISKALQIPTVKETLFPDFQGTLKSLGAWGGDFILATGDYKVPSFFKEKGYQTVIPYSEMVLKFEK